MPKIEDEEYPLPEPEPEPLEISAVEDDEKSEKMMLDSEEDEMAECEVEPLGNTEGEVKIPTSKKGLKTLKKALKKKYKE
jgi:hypothetical protein